MDKFFEYDTKRRDYLTNYEQVGKSVKNICLKYDRKARVIHFGSTVRGNWNGNSDIDLLIILQDQAAKDKIIVDVYREIEAPVELHFSSEETLANWYMRFIDVYKEV